MFRVTNQMRTNGVLDNIELNSDNLFTLQNQVSSGKRLTRPEDDPIGVGQDLIVRSDTADNNQYLRNIDQAQSWLSTNDGALQSIVSSVQRVRQLVVQGANGTLSATDEAAIDAEIHQLLLQVVQTSNQKLGDAYLFSGFATSTSPFTYNAATNSVVYNGTVPSTSSVPPVSGNIERQIAPGENLTVNVVGTQGFPSLFSTLSGIDRDFQTLSGGALTQSLSGTRLMQVDAVLSTFSNLLADNGAKANRVQTTSNQLSTNKVTLASLQSSTEDLDMAAAITQLQSEQSVYQASLATGAKVIQQTLLNFLQ